MNRNFLTPYAPLMRDVDEAGARKFAAKLWHENGMVIFLPDSIERMDWQDKELVRALAAKLYGQRKDDGS